MLHGKEPEHVASLGLPVTCVRVRTVTGSAFWGGDTCATFLAGHRSAVLPSMFTVPARERRGASAQVAWGREEGE